MSDNPRTPDAGLFLILPIPGKTKDMETFYAKVTAITVYSAPQPARHRVVEYQVTYWKESPIDVPEGNEGSLWLGGTEGLDSIFYFTTENQPWVIESLESGCIRDFLTYVVPNTKKPVLVNPVTKLYTPQQEGRCWDIYVKEQPTPLCTVIKLQQIETYTCQNNEALLLASSIVKYTLLGHDEEAVDIVYTQSVDWETAAYEYIAAPNTFTRRWTKRRIIQ